MKQEERVRKWSDVATREGEFVGRRLNESYWKLSKLRPQSVDAFLGEKEIVEVDLDVEDVVVGSTEPASGV